jgi:hypothetical protein
LRNSLLLYLYLLSLFAVAALSPILSRDETKPRREKLKKQWS